MSASRTNFADPAMREAAARNPAQSLSVQWTALQDAATAVAAMAGLAPERTSAQIRNFPALIKDAGGWRFELAEQTIADLTAMMQPGVTALLAVNARGQDAKVPALTLWHEFHRARSGVLGLVPDTGTLGPRRSA